MISTLNREEREERRKEITRSRTNGFSQDTGLSAKKVNLHAGISTLAKVSRRNRGPMRIHKVFLDVKEPFKVTSHPSSRTLRPP